MIDIKIETQGKIYSTIYTFGCAVEDINNSNNIIQSL